MKEAWDWTSDVRLRATVMSTMDPDEMLGGRRMEGNSIWMVASQRLARDSWNEMKLTSLLSWVRSTATPASTLPTVKEMSMLGMEESEMQ